MAQFFPQYTGTFKLEEPRALQRFSRAILPMALVTGVGLRGVRSIALTRGPNESLLVVASLIALGLVILFSMTALHLGNFTLQRWLWRAPVFAAVEAAAEALTSLLLISLHREPMGTSLATYADWPELVVRTFFWRLSLVVAFALLLAGVVQIVRFTLLKREHRGHTLDAVQHELNVQDQHKRVGE
ncbi:MAG: hypothetical protein ABIT38_06810 [Gemmatimonadaceae bacterium]